MTRFPSHLSLSLEYSEGALGGSPEPFPHFPDFQGGTQCGHLYAALLHGHAVRVRLPCQLLGLLPRKQGQSICSCQPVLQHGLQEALQHGSQARTHTHAAFEADDHAVLRELVWLSPCTSRQIPSHHHTTDSISRQSLPGNQNKQIAPSSQGL